MNLFNPFLGRRRTIKAASPESKPAEVPVFSCPPKPEKKLWECPDCGKKLKQGIARHQRICKG